MRGEKRGKSLTPAENERVRKVIRERLLPKYDGNQSLAGPAIGITQAGLSRILAKNGGGASLETAKALAKDLGMSISEVLGWPVAEVVPSGEPRFADIAAWAAASAEARRLFGDIIPGFAFDRADNSKGGCLPSVINAATVAALAKFWLASASQEERIAAEREEILAKKAEEDAAQSSHSRPVSTKDATQLKPRRTSS